MPPTYEQAVHYERCRDWSEQDEINLYKIGVAETLESTRNRNMVPEHLKALYDDAIDSVKSGKHREIAELLREYADVFAKDEYDIG